MEGGVPHVASLVDDLLDRVLHALVARIQEEPQAFLQTFRFVWKVFDSHFIQLESLDNDKLVS